MTTDINTAVINIHTALNSLGISTSREGRINTPERIAKFWLDFCDEKPEPKITMFKAQSEGMIVETGIPVRSICEHHGLPFFGVATIGYIPVLLNGKIFGLSKLPRIVEYFGTRFQTQEYLTSQIGEYIYKLLHYCGGVGVVIRAQHTCMSVRGVRAHGVWTNTTELYGCFKTDPATRAEFMAHHNHHPMA
jgi:GTP cyclohydrolase I